MFITSVINFVVIWLVIWMVFSDLLFHILDLVTSNTTLASQWLEHSDTRRVCFKLHFTELYSGMAALLGDSRSLCVKDSVLALPLQSGVMGALRENEPQYSCNYISWLNAVTVLHCCLFLLQWCTDFSLFLMTVRWECSVQWQESEHVEI